MFARPSTIVVRVFVSRLARIAAIACVVTTLATAAYAEETGVRSDESRGNAVTRWNAVALDAFAPSEGANPMMQSRTLAILHAAIHDALNAIDRRFEAYTPGLKAAPGASPDAAVAAAAREVLVTLVPEQAMLIDTAYNRALSALPDGPARTAGIATGEAAARATLTRRQDDGNATASEPAYVPRSGPGEYQFTPSFELAFLPGWGRVQPFAIDLKQHTLEGPLPLSSAQYARDLAYVKAVGDLASVTRTPEQSEIARFWYEDSPLGWNRIANTVVRQQGLDPWSTARAFALINFAMADGYIAGFEAKYRFRFWRPVTAIHEESPSWQPFLTTPPVPDYPSTHTVVGWSAAQVLMELFGDKVQYSTTSLTLPGVTRHFKGFSAAAQENGMSRVYAGIHFPHAVKDGERQGRSIGRAVAEGLAPARSK